MAPSDDIQIPVAQVQLIDTQQTNNQEINQSNQELPKEKSFRDFAKQKDDTESLKVLQQIAQS